MSSIELTNNIVEAFLEVCNYKGKGDFKEFIRTCQRKGISEDLFTYSQAYEQLQGIYENIEPKQQPNRYFRRLMQRR